MIRVKTILVLPLCLLAQWSMAQAPKWVEKAKQAVFSVVTYDQNDKILNTGNGFFVSEDGVALSDYTLFKGAKRAVIVNSEGKQMPVVNIMGADDMYDVVKFRVGTEKCTSCPTPHKKTVPARKAMSRRPTKWKGIITTTP